MSFRYRSSRLDIDRFFCQQCDGVPIDRGRVPDALPPDMNCLARSAVAELLSVGSHTVRLPDSVTCTEVHRKSNDGVDERLLRFDDEALLRHVNAGSIQINKVHCICSVDSLCWHAFWPASESAKKRLSRRFFVLYAI